VNEGLVDREYLTGVQYASDANLSARQAIYRFQQPRVRTASWALDLAQLGGREWVLDVGCGNGLHLGDLSRREHRGLVCGTDLSPGMLTGARSRSAAALLAGDAQAMPFGDATFDCVLAMHMLYHVPNRDLAIAEMRRVLRPGGVALALTNSHLHLEELNQLLSTVLRDVVGSAPESMRGYLTFSSESGAPELRRHFASVERHDVRSELVVTEVEPIVAYVASMGAVAGPVSDAVGAILREVDRRARAMIEADGAFRIRTDVGCFICR
jgi:ubiquinone/menaquinone biosynthesis C-methylase UbiE